MGMKREKAVTRKDLHGFQDSMVALLRAEMDGRLAPKLDTATFEARLEERLASKLDTATFEARLEERLASKLDTAVFEARMDKVERNIRLLQLDAVDKSARMDAMEGRLNARMDALSRTVSEKLDGAVGRMETLWRETVTFPRVLDAHGAQLAGHEARIASLEARRAP